MNDVYEITPLEGGKFGGLARVSTLRKELITKNPNTFTILSGDFISPSALGTAEYNDKRINGAQMIDVLNHLGMDYVIFGNHEFDVKLPVLQERINESNFTWFSSNIYQKVFILVDNNTAETSMTFCKSTKHAIICLDEYQILRVKSRSGKEVKIGMIGLTLNSVNWAVYEDEYKSALLVYNFIKDSVDFVIAMTHLPIDEDRELAKRLPQLKLIMGGHEHVHNYVVVGNTIITKADANARTVYIHDIIYDEKDNSVKINSELKTIDESIPDDPEVKQVADMWVQRAYEGFKSKGLNPDEVVTVLKEPLDGLEEDIRYKPTNLGAVIAQSMLSLCEKCKAAIFNSGAVRIDDKLYGEITQYDIIRTLPFGGKIIEVEMKGSLLEKILNTGLNNVGNGGFLQYTRIERLVPRAHSGYWVINGNKISTDKNYRIAISDFLLTGQEQNMGFLTRDNPDIISIIDPDASNPNDLRNDIRLAVINYLKKK